MFQILTSPSQLNYEKIMQVYQQSIQQSGVENYPDLEDNRQLLEAEQDFYLYLNTFLRQKDSFCAVWVEEGSYISALRIEPYRDGVLIAGLETAPTRRKMGYAKKLLSATVQYLDGKNIPKIYSHIHKNNIASVKTHISCGFVCAFDYAAFVDGSVDYQSRTYIKQSHRS